MFCRKYKHINHNSKYKITTNVNCKVEDRNMPLPIIDIKKISIGYIILMYTIIPVQ